MHDNMEQIANAIGEIFLLERGRLTQYYYNNLLGQTYYWNEYGPYHMALWFDSGAIVIDTTAHTNPGMLYSSYLRWADQVGLSPMSKSRFTIHCDYVHGSKLTRGGKGWRDFKSGLRITN